MMCLFLEHCLCYVRNSSMPELRAGITHMELLTELRAGITARNYGRNYAYGTMMSQATRIKLAVW